MTLVLILAWVDGHRGRDRDPEHTVVDASVDTGQLEIGGQEIGGRTAWAILLLFRVRIQSEQKSEHETMTATNKIVGPLSPHGCKAKAGGCTTMAPAS
jgi:hypothetical protein